MRSNLIRAGYSARPRGFLISVRVHCVETSRIPEAPIFPHKMYRATAQTRKKRRLQSEANTRCIHTTELRARHA